MASHLLLNLNRLSQRAILLQNIKSPLALVSQYHGRAKIGKREVVGFGMNGEYSYIDALDHPCPAIRFKENTPEINKLKEKEKGDWKKLTMEEKKTLYRSSFCRTYAEMQNSSNGEWKSVLAGALTLAACALWVMVLLKKFVYPPMPESTSEENKLRTVDFMIKYRINPIEGIASKWDYENNRWKD